MKRQAGMTLIEVMVALVIFALAGLTVMQSTLQQTRQLGRMEEKILASWLADNQLVQLRLEKRWPPSAGPKPPWKPPERAGLSAGREWKPRCRSCGRWTWRSGGKKAIPRRWRPCAPG